MLPGRAGAYAARGQDRRQSAAAMADELGEAFFGDTPGCQASALA